MDVKIALEDHATTEANNALWDSGVKTIATAAPTPGASLPAYLISTATSVTWTGAAWNLLSFL